MTGSMESGIPSGGTGDRNLKPGFANLLRQLPGCRYEDGSDYRLIVFRDGTRHLIGSSSVTEGLTVFSLGLHLGTLDWRATAQTPWDYLCKHQTPVDGIKERRFSFTLNKRLSQAALIFVQRVLQNFDLEKSLSLHRELTTNGMQKRARN